MPGIRHDLALICPGNNDGLAGLEPDSIGEHHVAEFATDALVDACLAWSGEDRAQRQRILTCANRATRDEHGVKAVLCHRSAEAAPAHRGRNAGR